jgi:trk system potassium uptake protein TrkA
VEVKVPSRYVGMSVGDANIRKEFSLNIMTTIKIKEQTNILGIKLPKRVVAGVISPDYVLEEDDILLLFGKIKNLQDFLNLDG